jgi:hypothetical protein
MKPIAASKIPMILVGLGTALLLSPACKAQEVNPDHFTETGVEGVYENVPAQVTAPKVKQKPSTLQTRARQTNSPATLRATAERSPWAPRQHGAQEVSEKRRPAPTTSRKP